MTQMELNLNISLLTLNGLNNNTKRMLMTMFLQQTPSNTNTIYCHGTTISVDVAVLFSDKIDQNIEILQVIDS